jgi:anti-anti-sigma factor
VDVATVDEIRTYLKRLKASSFTRVILDLRGVTFLDAQGVRLILEADASSRADGWSFALIGGCGDHRSLERHRSGSPG